MATGYIFDKRYIDHTLEWGHPEAPERLVAIETHMRESGLDREVVPLRLLDDPLPAIRAIHTKTHISSVQNIPKTGVIAELAAAGALGAVKAVSEGIVTNAFCALRPPGHHAHNNGGEEGFCFYNNIAIAARYAQNQFHFQKILILDWDYHHGNGTEFAFYDDPSVLFFSTHHWYAYPGTGDPSKKGSGDGFGFNINVPLQAGATDDEVIKAWEKILIPNVETFKPDFVLISAGFDSREDDILGCFRFTDKGFAALTTMARTIADTCCNGRLVSFLEGGYTPDDLAKAVAAHVGALI